MMEIIFQVSVVIVALYIIIQLINISSILYFENDTPAKRPGESEFPMISVLVAARNEEVNITRCLQALHESDYPASKIEFLIGNDQSNDATASLIEAFIKDKPAFKLFHIKDSIGRARGKANVLAQLAKQAKGEYYLITDADVAVNKQWARELVSFFDERTGIVSGITIVEDKGTMGKMQEIDWMYFMGLLKSFYNLGLNCTAVGNNMAISRKAYESVGGYESIDFSITEDYKLYKEVRKRNWETRNVLNEFVINRSVATHSFRTLMHQRKRWLVGARELPFYWWFLFGVFGLFAPAIIVMFFHSIKLALICYGIKLALQSFTVYILQDKMNVRKNMDYLMTYEVYSIVVAISTQLFYMLPVKLKWKDRSYNV